jgi:nitrogenase-stabilizing/protective protein
MSILETLRRLSAAEEFFELLEVPYDPQRVRVVRLHILRRLGEYLASADLEGRPDEEVRDACRAHLARAYDDFVRSSPIEERVFKVLKDAVAPKEPPKKPFVPLDTLMVGTSAGGPAAPKP